ncbi:MULTISPECIES: peptidase domain-containing ABC transporter [Xanthomonas]|uniref:peptidase domain-containing ABC transporter n=1 Tax=Xanthomonas TaxID=338 RepID=UPI001263C03E|nr:MULTISPECIES: peptidase domain-containing ABC transporter [Xanthomonas]KAB7778944.1 ABC transporter [Xanthomonas sp. LMG 12459]MCW0455917.1 Toxin RTX-I translocation ATP-binding protein [Xanthomonas sacchari]
MIESVSNAPSEASRGDTRDGLRFGWSRALPVIMQTEAAECGSACLAMIAAYHGYDIDLPELRRRFATSLKGQTLNRLMVVADQLGFTCRPMKVDIEDLRKLSVPCILHWDMNHFVVLRKVGSAAVTIHDPAQGARTLHLNEVSKYFTGVAMEITPSANFRPASIRSSISLRSIIGKVRGLIPALSQIFILALALEVFTLATPFYLQWVIDQVLVSADQELLVMLGVGFLGVVLLSALVFSIRSWAVTWLGATLSVQLASNLFSHLMRLPQDWYEKRHMGDIVSRFGSIQTIQQTLTSQFVSSFLDGLMSLIILFVMSFYSFQLTALVVGLFLIYGIIRWVFFLPLRRANEEKIVCAARQQSELLESIKGSMSIKLANRQNERLRRYTNATVAVTNRDVGIQRLNVAFVFISHLLFGLGRVVLIWIAAVAVMRGNFTVGALIAFIAYADQFTNRAAGFIDKFAEFRVLKLHAERVADITMTEPEHIACIAWRGPIPEPSIELVDVSFRYADSEPWILKDCNLRIEVGTSLAIVGPSGEGKSTLAKIILGLLVPTKGQILFGGIDIRKLGVNNYRMWTAAVMQDDQLFAGSISENIGFFDPDFSQEKIVEAAQMAAIHEDIMRMPMGYQSLVGDMGSSLSGGQKQRVILARALYRKPKVIVLDEATSHLDVECEILVNSAIGQLNATRIIIAHRPETFSKSDIVMAMHNGRLTSVDEFHGNQRCGA